MQSMKQIVQNKQLSTLSEFNKQARKQPKASATPNSKNSGSNTEQVNKIFLKFSTYFGNLWRSQFKNDYYSDFARNEWSKALQKFDEQLIEEALDECLKRTMPPALAQFIECCKHLSSRKTGFFREEVYERGDPKVALEHLKKIKTILGMK